MASYARMWDRFEEAGLRAVAICVDPVENNRAMVEKLLLPFPVLSDPEAIVIKSWGLWNEPERVAKPALFLVLPDRSAPFSYVGSDFADRPPDEEIFAAAAAAPGVS